MPKLPVIYIDGKYVNADQKLIDIFTPGRATYHGVFETMLVQGKNIAYIDEHLARLSKGLKKLNIKSSYPTSRFKTIANMLVKKNTLKGEGRLRLLVFKQGKAVHCVGLLLPYQRYSDAVYKKGLKAIVVKTNRKANALHANVKSLDYALFANAFQEAKAQGADEAILMNEKGHVFEASRGNIFVCYKDQWLTPPLSSGCLNGIVRQRVIDLSLKGGLTIKEINITPVILKKSKNIFMTNALVGLMRLEVQKTFSKK